MVTWYVDEGLDRLIDEWKGEYPGAVVYTIGDTAHSSNPNVSQHAPDWGGSKPGDDKGEVDGGDFMPGKGGVTEDDLDDLAENLRKSKDPRILMVIRRQRIFSSIVQPWVWRPYGGNYHGHTHVSMNDNFDRNAADWKWEDEEHMAREYTYREIPGGFPELRLGDEDVPGRTQHIRRVQGLLNTVFGTKLDVDGAYGSKTAAAIAQVMKSDPNRTTTNGTKLYVPEIKRIFGIW